MCFLFTTIFYIDDCGANMAATENLHCLSSTTLLQAALMKCFCHQMEALS